MKYETENFVDDYVFLEGPRWHDGALWISDMWAHTVYRIDENGKHDAVVEVPNRPSGLGFLPDGSPIVVSMADRKIYCINGAALELYADLNELVSADINDMVVDAHGRAYVGNFGYDLFSGEEARAAELVLIDADRRCRIVAEGLEFPNGMVIKNGGTELVVAETFAHCLTAFDIEANGELSNRRTYADLGELTPDGICLDADDHIWVASFMTGDFVRLNLDGQIVDEIKVDSRAVACQLGGADGKTLYCLVYDGEIEDIASGNRGARIETVRVAVGAGGSP